MPKTAGVIAGLVAATLGLLAPTLAIPANDALDRTTTGSVGGALEAGRPDARGSAEFRAAIRMLNAGEVEAAFEAASALSSLPERRAVQWAAIHYHPGRIGHGTVAAFIAEAPDFAAGTLYQTRLEQALAAGNVPHAEIAAALGDAAPQTIDAQIALALAHLAAGETTSATTLARAVWVENFLTNEQEALVRSGLGDLLGPEDHWARAERLMMHDRIQAAERLNAHFGAAEQSLITARAATARRQGNGKTLLDAVDESLHEHPVFIFTRVQRARLAGLLEQAVDWLDKAPQTVPEPREWWIERRLITRALLAEGRADLAYRAAAGHVEGPAGGLVEAQFHAGWIALSFLGDAEAARGHFITMAAHATLPDSITQAHFWLARAEIARGDFAAADAAYGVAAQFGTVYYGQLARAELGLGGVPLRPLPDWRATEPAFSQYDAVLAVRLFAANGETGKAATLLRQWAGGLEAGADLVLAARLAQEIGAHNVAIAIAENARGRGVALDAFSFPTAGLPADARFAADRAAVYAVARQESLFQRDAVSHAGARGLMQLMPGTARETAERLGLAYSRDRLVQDGAYNVLLGSTYLADQLRRYEGSLLLAAAAYNAGPGNANRWIRAYGDPRAANVDPVVWVELIPFAETRTYVRRVLGNYLVYRERLGQEAIGIADALRRIP